VADHAREEAHRERGARRRAQPGRQPLVVHREGESITVPEAFETPAHAGDGTCAPGHVLDSRDPGTAAEPLDDDGTVTVAARRAPIVVRHAARRQAGGVQTFDTSAGPATGADPSGGALGRAAGRTPPALWLGLGAALLLVLLAVLVPRWLDWQVYSHAHPRQADVAPLHARWDPKVGVGTLPVLLLGLLAWRYGHALARRLRWDQLLAATYLGGLAWLLALAYVDGSAGISRALGNSYEYLETARATTDVSAMLAEYVDRIPRDAPGNWVTHVAGHPPGALLFFVLLDRLGLGGDWSAGMVVTVLAASTPVSVLVTLRALDAEAPARRAAPFLVIGPAAIWTAVSADGMFAAVVAGGLAALALGATRPRRNMALRWSVLAGALLGYCMLLSYGLPLIGLLAVAVLLAARSWSPLPVAAVTAGLVVLGFAAGGFALWEAFPVLRERYWDGVASRRPASYWLWANLGALALSAGPLLGAALAQLVARRRHAGRTLVLLVGAAAAALLLADLSLMSKGETERIWLPFVPWLLIATAMLTDRWAQAGLALQVVVAVVLQHLLYTSW